MYNLWRQILTGERRGKERSEAKRSEAKRSEAKRRENQHAASLTLHFLQYEYVPTVLKRVSFAKTKTKRTCSCIHTNTRELTDVSHLCVCIYGLVLLFFLFFAFSFLSQPFWSSFDLSLFIFCVLIISPSFGSMLLSGFFFFLVRSFLLVVECFSCSQEVYYRVDVYECGEFCHPCGCHVELFMGAQTLQKTLSTRRNKNHHGTSNVLVMAHCGR